MDVGCGTGILSLLMAKAGAKRVIAVESSDIADCATQIMIDNKMDHIITVVKGKHI
jgi:ribosomal protein L11 methylase PrmA